MIKLHDGRCSVCGRSAAADGAVLQVHHPRYINDRKPWEYKKQECEVLCKGCHAEEHGLIMPKSDWALIGADDLGELCGACEKCGTALRYIYAIEHIKWGALAVGTRCCDKLTQSKTASEYHDRCVRLADKRKRFVDSDRWHRASPDCLTIRRANITAFIYHYGDKFRIGFDGVLGKKDYERKLDAKLAIFEWIESGNARIWLDDRKRKRQFRHKYGDNKCYWEPKSEINNIELSWRTKRAEGACANEPRYALPV